MKKVILLFAVVFCCVGLAGAVDSVYLGAINTSTRTACVSGSNVISDVQLTNGTTIALTIDFLVNPSLTSRGTYKESVIVASGATSKFGVGNAVLRDFCVCISTSTPLYDSGVATTALLTGTVFK